MYITGDSSLVLHLRAENDELKQKLSSFDVNFFEELENSKMLMLKLSRSLECMGDRMVKIKEVRVIDGTSARKKVEK